MVILMVMVGNDLAEVALQRGFSGRTRILIQSRTPERLKTRLTMLYPAPPLTQGDESAGSLRYHRWQNYAVKMHRPRRHRRKRARCGPQSCHLDEKDTP